MVGVNGRIPFESITDDHGSTSQSPKMSTTKKNEKNLSVGWRVRVLSLAKTMHAQTTTSQMDAFGVADVSAVCASIGFWKCRVA